MNRMPLICIALLSAATSFACDAGEVARDQTSEHSSAASRAAPIGNGNNPLRYGMHGAPPGAFGAQPSEPSTPGAHWVVGYDADGQPSQWQRLGGEHSTDARHTVTLLIDDAPPSAVLSFSGPVVETADATLINGQTAISIEATDASGGISAVLLIDGEDVKDATAWLSTRADGSYQLATRTSDALGNTGVRGGVDVLLDTTPPALTWLRHSGRGADDSAIPIDVFDGKRARLAITVSDAHAGFQRLQLGERDFTAADFAEGTLDITVDANSLDYVIEDRLGNSARGNIALRADQHGPTLHALRNDVEIDLDGARLRRSDSLRLSAQDSLSGVSRACIEASIWYNQCRELPIDLVGIAPGRYALQFRAADRLGNKTFQRLSMEVVP